MAAQPALFETFEAPDRMGRASVTLIDSLHLLCKGKGRTASFDYTLNPYRGCSFGCSYCYAAFFEPNEDRRANWGTWVEVKHRALAALSKVDLRDKKIYMSSATDPYQPVEAETKLTRDIVTHLAAHQARLVVQTRSPLVTRDIDLLRRFSHVRVNLSITTDSDEVRKRYEPNCTSIERRLEAAYELKRAGIPVSVCVCPMLPMKDPAAFGRRLNEIGVDNVAASWFHESGRAAFAANTRDEAFALAAKDGWTKVEFRRCASILVRTCRAFGNAARAFGPQ